MAMFDCVAYDQSAMAGSLPTWPPMLEAHALPSGKSTLSRVAYLRWGPRVEAWCTIQVLFDPSVV